MDAEGVPSPPHTTLYRALWLGAFLGLALHLAGIGIEAANDSWDRGLSSPGAILTLVGIGLACASLLGVALAWLSRHVSPGRGRTAQAVRLTAIPLVGIAVAGAVWLAGLGEDDGSPGVDTAAVAALEHGQAAQASAQQEAANPHAGHEANAAVGASTGPEAEGAPHTHAAEVDVTEGQLEAASTFVAAVKADVAKYEDVSAAMADGYVQITQDLPAIAAHFVRMDYLQDGHEMDPERPEFLLYSKRLDGSWRLLGVMFYAETDSETPPSYFGPLDTWHFHEHLCFTTVGVRVAASASECLGQYVERTRWQLHVWTRDGAEGVFAHDYAPINPGGFPPAVLSAAREVGSRTN